MNISQFAMPAAAAVAAFVFTTITYKIGKAAGASEERSRRAPEDSVAIIDRLMTALAPFAIHGNVEMRWTDYDNQSVQIAVGKWRRAWDTYGEVRKLPAWKEHQQ